jgi:hypothetical protein
MQFDPHERARFLSDEARISGIPAEDEAWMGAHLAACEDCARYDAATQRVIAALSGFSFEAPAGRRVASPVRRHMMSRWAVAAVAMLVLAAVPLYRASRKAQQERADAELLEAVQHRVSRQFPRAMEPLVTPNMGESR